MTDSTDLNDKALCRALTKWATFNTPKRESDAFIDGYSAARAALSAAPDAKPAGTLKDCVLLEFPTYLRKMWSGSEVQDWLNELPMLFTLPPEYQYVPGSLSAQEIRREALEAPDAEQDRLDDGYISSTLISGGDSHSITLHYKTARQAKFAHSCIVSEIDAAQAKEPK